MKEKVDLVVQVNNIKFIPNNTYRIELSFSTKYTIEEITKLTNEYIKDCSHYFESQTQIPKYYRKIHLKKEPSILW